MKPRPRVLLVSGVLPDPRDAGGRILERHLRDYSDVLALAPGGAAGVRCPVAVVRPSRLAWLWARWPEHRFLRVLRVAGCAAPGRLADAARVAARFRPDVLLAVAHGEMPFLAARLARRTRLPLVLIFHDWWPDYVPTRLRGVLDFRYRRLFRRCDAALCVSATLQRMLGAHPNALVLPPLPGSSLDDTPPEAAASFELHYHGNMTGCYRTPLISLLKAFDRPGWRIRLAGDVDDWTAEDRALALRVGGYAGCLPDADVPAMRRRAGGYLVALSFFAGDRRRVQTSFPSKLVDYCQTPRPIVVWGPGDSAAAEWCRRTGAAVLVDTPAPTAVLDEVDRLIQNPGRGRALADAARREARSEFSSDRIRGVFDEVLANPRGAPSATA